MQYYKNSSFTRMKFGPVYIFGTTLANSTDYTQWDLVKVYAYVDERILKKSTDCCLKYKNGSDSEYYQQPIQSMERPVGMTILSTYHYTCANRRPGVIPDGIAITFKNYTCSEEHVTYRKPFLPLREPVKKLALCTKLWHGPRGAEMIIEWMETYIYLGVDKVISYFLNNLNSKAKQVLQYYASTGILDLYLFEPTATGMVRRLTLRCPIFKATSRNHFTAWEISYVLITTVLTT